MSEKKPVLIICDSDAGQTYLGVLLNRIWYSPHLARTAVEAVELAWKTPFSLVLFDGDVAETELTNAITLLRTAAALKTRPLVVFLTDDDPEKSRSLLAQGCSTILTKPVDLALVYGVLSRLSGQPRSTPRVLVKIPIEIEEGIPDRVLISVNLSEGGLYLRTTSPQPEGTLLHVTFKLPYDTEAISVTAEVVRALSPGAQFEATPGIGLRFLDMHEDTRLRIRNFVQWEMTGDLEWKPAI